MRVPTTFRARRGLRTVVLAGLLSAYYGDANARLAMALDATAPEGMAGVGVGAPVLPPVCPLAVGRSDPVGTGSVL